MTKLRSVIAFCVLAQSPACVMSDSPDESEDTQDLVSTRIANPNPRLEIGRFGGAGGGCTATMIRSNWILMAAHCWGWFDGRDAPGVDAIPDFWTTTNGRFSPPAGIAKVDRTFAFTSFFGQLHNKDILLARLETRPSGPAVPFPAAIATAAPTSGPVTIWGAGCTGSLPDPAPGALRIFETTAGTATSVLCPGDSGGPKVVGAFETHGAIYGINSALGDSFADPMQFKAQIDAVIHEYDLHGADDIYATGWCTAANERRYDIDANGDGEPDALCFNAVTGQRKVATSTSRLVRQTWTSGGPWCTAAGSELLTGDFDGDHRTDLLCHDRTTGTNQIDFGRDGYPGAGGSTVTLAMNQWCSHATAQLLTGDFDGDGRTDLLCHDTSTGMKWLDLAAPSGPIFNGASDYISTNNFCSHAGAKLLVGDTDGNLRSDLICHTPSSGMLHIDRTYAGHMFEGVDAWLDPSPTLGGFCTSGRVVVGDFDGDKHSDLQCVKPSGATWPSIYASSEGWFSWDYAFGDGGLTAPRTISAAAQPASFER